MISKERLHEALRRVLCHPSRGDARAKAAYEEAQKIAEETGELVGDALWALATFPDPKKASLFPPDKPDPGRKAKNKDKLWTPGQIGLWGGGA